MKRDIRRCKKCEHYVPYKMKSGAWTKVCESWECEFEPIKQYKKFDVWEDTPFVSEDFKRERRAEHERLDKGK